MIAKSESPCVRLTIYTYIQDKLTVDFKLRYNRNNKWYISCVGNDGIDVDVKEANFPEPDILPTHHTTH